MRTHRLETRLHSRPSPESSSERKRGSFRLGKFSLTGDLGRDFTAEERLVQRPRGGSGLGVLESLQEKGVCEQGKGRAESGKDQALQGLWKELRRFQG